VRSNNLGKTTLYRKRYSRRDVPVRSRAAADGLYSSAVQRYLAPTGSHN
jgi:hypothetical protein